MNNCNNLKFNFIPICSLLFLWCNCPAQSNTSAKPVLLFETVDTHLTSFKITYYVLDLYIDPNNKFISGFCTMYFKLLRETDSIDVYLDKSLTIKQITDINQSLLSFSRYRDRIRICLSKKMNSKSGINSIILFYSGVPKVSKLPPWDGGFVWSKDSTGNPFCGIVCQLDGAKIWWPNKNVWYEKPDSILFTVRVPMGLTAISNGRLKSCSISQDGKSIFNWYMPYPMLPYNLTVYIGKYDHFWEYLQTVGDSLLLDFYVLPENNEMAKTHFKQVGRIISVYEKYFGVFPFKKCGFKLVEAPYLGMEHQSAIGYGNKYKDGLNGFNTAPFDFNYDHIILHETAHEWWGNSVSAMKIQDMWIHESFACYSESLFIEEMLGYDSAVAYIMQDVSNLMENKYPMCDSVNGTRYGNDFYAKGSAIWNTFRNLIRNDSLWFSFLKNIQHDYQYRSISTKELIGYINEHFHDDFGWFFDQYVFNPNIPVLSFKKDQDSTGMMFYRWESCVKDFKLPVNFKSKTGDNTLRPTEEWQSFTPDISIPEIYKKLTRNYLIKITIRGTYW